MRGRNGEGAEGRDVREEVDTRKRMAVREKEICPHGITCRFGA